MSNTIYVIRYRDNEESGVFEQAFRHEEDAQETILADIQEAIDSGIECNLLTNPEDAQLKKEFNDNGVIDYAALAYEGRELEWWVEALFLDD